MNRWVIVALTLLASAPAVAGTDPLLLPPPERPSASIPLIVGGWATVGGVTTLDSLFSGQPKLLPVVRAAAYADVYGVSFALDDVGSWLAGVDHRGNAGRDFGFWAVGLHGGSIADISRFGVVATAVQRTGRWTAEGRGWAVESETRVLLPPSLRWNPLGTYFGTEARYAYRVPMGRTAVLPGVRLGVAYDLARSATDIRFGLDVKVAASADLENR